MNNNNSSADNAMLASDLTSSIRRCYTHDIDQHAQNLADWQLRYDQLTSGRFDGELIEFCAGWMQLVRDRSNQSMLKSSSAWSGAITVSVPLTSRWPVFCGGHHENLMDLTHLSFLHANTIGTPDYASAPYKLDLKEVHYTLIREVVQTTLSPVWGKTTGLGECNTAARITTSESLSHALHRVSVSFYDSAAPVDKREHFHIRTAHILTPETANTLHYFIVHGRDFAKQDAALGNFMHEQLFAAFNEDVEGMGALEAVMGDVDDQHYEISVANGSPAVAMRMYLKKRAEAER